MMLLWLFIGCRVDSPLNDTVVDNLQTEDTGILQSFEVTGTIFDENDEPVSEAMVMIGGKSEDMVFTDIEGNFSLWFEDNGYGEPAVVATKHGYRTVGYEFFEANISVYIKIRKIQGPDNEEYIFQDPGNGFDSMEENCSHCHSSFVLEFLESKHSESAKNPLLHSLYSGTTQIFAEEACLDQGGLWKEGTEPGTLESVFKCYVNSGVLPDINNSCGAEEQLSCDNPNLTSSEKPEHFGECADCHAPAINGSVGNRDLLEAKGIEYELGVHCDFCHKVQDIDISLPAGVGGRLILGRPSEPGRNTFEWDPVFYGPIPDVPNVAMAGSHQPKFNESLFCAGCHEHKQQALVPQQEINKDKWPEGIDVQTTYSEWKNGPYNQEETQCQFCHMPANTEQFNAIDISMPKDESITFGFQRAPEDIRKHLFRGPLQGEPRLIDTALYTSIDAEIQNNQMDVTVSVANIGCGHAVPTGEPMRVVFLVVEAHGSCGKLHSIFGPTLPDTVGAYSQGIVGEDIQIENENVFWVNGHEKAEIGQVLRFVRPTGGFIDYEGVGYFSNEQLSDAEKGLDEFSFVGSFTIEHITDEYISLSGIPSVQDGDFVFLGDEWTTYIEDGQDSLNLSGQIGQAYAKVLVDEQGNRNVPHYKAIDIVSDNRILPGQNVLSSYSFEIPSNCENISVSAKLIYRPIPIKIATQRNVDAIDYIIGSSLLNVTP